MITGDHKVTATAIAQQIGIFREGTGAVRRGAGRHERRRPEQRLADLGLRPGIPEHKIRIVRRWQRKGKIVSMTGDGVNDAPALKPRTSAWPWASPAQRCPRTPPP